MLVFKEPRVLRVPKGQEVHKGLKVPQVPLGHKERKDHSDQKVMVVLQGILAHKGLLVQSVHKGRKEFQVLGELPAHKAVGVRKEPKELLESLVALEHKETEDLKEYRVLKALLE
jgi:hypothetical protein